MENQCFSVGDINWAPTGRNFSEKKVGGRSVEISREVSRHPPVKFFQKENKVPIDNFF